MNEIDDGCFDWMIVLENKRKQRELQKEADQQQQKSPQVQQIEDKQNVSSPMQSTFGVLGSPTTPNVVIEKTETPKSEQPDVITSTTPAAKETNVKKSNKFQRLFCCGAKNE